MKNERNESSVKIVTGFYFCVCFLFVFSAVVMRRWLVYKNLPSWLERVPYPILIWEWYVSETKNIYRRFGMMKVQMCPTPTPTIPKTVKFYAFEDWPYLHIHLPLTKLPLATLLISKIQYIISYQPWQNLKKLWKGSHVLYFSPFILPACKEELNLYHLRAVYCDLRNLLFD